MKKFLWCVLFAGVACLAQNQSTIGFNIIGSVGTNANNFQYAQQVVILNTINITDGFVFEGTGGTSGDKIDILITAATGFNTQGATALCHGTFTDAGSSSNTWIHITFSGCQLTPGNYWISYNSNELSTTNWGKYSGAGGACLVASNLATSLSGNACDWSVAQTYGSYSGLTTTFASQGTLIHEVYVVGTPVPSNTAVTSASNLSTYGSTVNTLGGNATATGTLPSFFLGNYVTINQPLANVTGWAFLGNGGTAGDKVDFLITAASTWQTQATSATCHATFTEVTGTINAWTSFNLSSCGTLAAGNYFIGVDMNDSGLGLGQWNAAPCCNSGATNIVNWPWEDAYFLAQTYGTYTGFTATMGGQDSNDNFNVYITGIPPTSHGGRAKGVF